jgi:hypothetical protein
VIRHSLAALFGLALVAACGAPAPAPAQPTQPPAPHPPAPHPPTSPTVQASSPAPTTAEAPADRDAALARLARVLGAYTITDEAIARLQLVGTSPETIASVSRLDLMLAPDVRIFLKPNGQPGINLERARDGTFYNAHDDIRIAFELPATGHVSSIIVTQGPLVLRYAYAD